MPGTDGIQTQRVQAGGGTDSDQPHSFLRVDARKA